jgi:hypothetical protein
MDELLAAANVLLDALNRNWAGIPVSESELAEALLCSEVVGEIRDQIESARSIMGLDERRGY